MKIEHFFDLSILLKDDKELIIIIIIIIICFLRFKKEKFKLIRYSILVSFLYLKDYKKKNKDSGFLNLFFCIY